MKKIYYAAVALTALTFAACSQEDDFIQKSNVPVTNSLTATIEDLTEFSLDDPESRATYTTSNGSVTFSKNDQIIVMNTSAGSQTFSYAGSTSKTFTGTIPEGTNTTEETYAFFPADAISGSTVILPTSYTANSFKLPMYGTITVDAENQSTVNFKQLGAGLRLVVTSDQKGATITLTAQEALAGNATISEVGGEKQLALSGTGSNSVTLQLGATSYQGTFYVALVPGTYNLTISDGVNADKTFGEFTVTRGQMATGTYAFTNTISMDNTTFSVGTLTSGNFEVVNITEDVTTSSNIAFGTFASGSETLNLGSNTITQTSRGNFATVMTRGSKNLTINANDDGGLTNADNTNPGPVVWNSGSGTITINGGTYTTNNAGAECIYCQTGVINITGGVYKINGSSVDNPDAAKFLLNCKDDHKGNIHVTGGKFYDFDPANNTADGAGTNYVEDGYVSVHSVEADEAGVLHDVYTVLPATTTGAANVKAIVDDANQSTAITLSEDVALAASYLLAKGTTAIDLNGKTVTNTSTTYAPITSYGGGTLTLEGTGTVEALGSNMAACWVDSNSVLNITGGNYYSTPDVNASGGPAPVIYIMNTGGTVNISGGTFRARGSNNTNEVAKFLLNCYDANYTAGTAKFVVTGGTFYDFNPAASTAEPGGNANWVPAGYTVQTSVVTDAEGTHNVYTVVKE